MAWISASIVLLLSVLLVVACKLRRRRPERESFPDYEVRYHSVRGSSRAHPHFVYDRSRGRGREKDVLKSVSITHDPHSVKGRSLRLWDNPRKGDRRKAYIPPDFYMDSEKKYGRKQKNLSVSRRDRRRIERFIDRNRRKEIRRKGRSDI